jgi:hypothetical protein
MNLMTPYSLAFTIIRVIAVLMLAVGILKPLGFLLEKMTYPGGDFSSNLSFAFNDFLLTVLPGGALYILAHWLAKATIWKIKE